MSTTQQAAQHAGLEDAATPFSVLALIAGQVYLLWLVLSGRWQVSQVMLINCLETALVCAVTTFAFSYTWRGMLHRCGELLMLVVVMLALMLGFGWLELQLGNGAGNEDISKWFDAMRAMSASDNIVHGLVYIGVVIGSWLLVAVLSGRARKWWAANAGGPSSVTFVALFVACAAAVALMVLLALLEQGLAAIGVDGRNFVRAIRDYAPIAMLIVFCAARIFLSWKMVTMLSPDDWRKVEAKFYFDAPVA